MIETGAYSDKISRNDNLFITITGLLTQRKMS